MKWHLAVVAVSPKEHFRGLAKFDRICGKPAGSVRVVTKDTGAVVARFDDDPGGSRLTRGLRLVSFPCGAGA